jgi:hypothetical protein
MFIVRIEHPVLWAAAAVMAAGVLAAAPLQGQVGAAESPDPLVGCYAFTGSDEQSGRTIEARFRLTAEPSAPETSPRGSWWIATGVPGERPQPGLVSWSIGANSVIRVLWNFDAARALLQFPRIAELSSDAVEGMLAGPGPEPGVAQTARGSVVRVSC